jgi:hypothetical protein
MPNVAAVSPVLSELDVVAMGLSALLEDEHQLMLTAIERSHPGVIFRPHTEIL